MKKTWLFCLGLLAVGVVESASAKITPNALFNDNGVLQRGRPIPIWGTANDGEQITVELAGQKLSTTARDGKWMVRMKSLKAGGPYTLTIAGENTVTLTNILIGDVWVASGQSNMERPLADHNWHIPVDNEKEEIAAANYPTIREFTVPKKIAYEPQTDTDGHWTICSPETVGDYSAVGYFFARDLQKDVNVPIGILFSSWGGTVAEAWTSKESLETMPDFTNALAKLQPPANGKKNPNQVTVLYNGMIVPLEKFPIKGVIWYQGESNAGRAKQYQTLFPLMIKDWRQAWGIGNFPFLFVQIAPYKGMIPEIREAQLLTLEKSPNTAMAVITDAGDANNIHPPHKQVVGARLALEARALAYGEKMEYSGPLYRSLKVKGNEAIVRFTHVGGGLVAKDGDLKGFTIAGADGKFVPAKAEIKGKTVVVTSDEVAKPMAVRFGWNNVPDVNFYNKEGLPASPFRTDVK
jgi:sialate O-acetylesterase